MLAAGFMPLTEELSSVNGMPAIEDKTVWDIQMDKMKNKFTKTATKELCPFIKNPTDGCYCLKHNSQSVEATIYYCGENFKKCIIYKRLTDK